MAASLNSVYADEDLGEDLRGGLVELGLAVQQGQGELVGPLDVRRFLGVARALQALDQRNGVLQPVGLERGGLLQVDVGLAAILVGQHDAELVVDPRRVGVRGQEFAKVLLRACGLTGPAQEDHASFHQPLMARHDLQGLHERLLGLGRPQLLGEDAHHVEPGLDAVALDRHGLPEAHESGVDLALLGERAAELALELGIAGLGPDQLGIDGLGPRRLTQVEQHVA